MKRTLLLLSASLAMTLSALGRVNGHIATENLEFHRSGTQFLLGADLVLDSIHIGGNDQFLVSPIVSIPDGEAVVLPAVLINGRNMHIAWERGTIRQQFSSYEISTELRRLNGKAQTVSYSARTPLKPWMLNPKATVSFVVDTCGCGMLYGKDIMPPTLLNLNPAPRMRLTYITPAVTELPVSIHEGRARVQFEVDKTELHAEPYRCRNGQRIDNREQLRAIDDTVSYALSNPNVEIASISICGYASPESPYTHNDFLATNRSRALAEYLGERYHLPAGAATYSAVPENWEEFREIVVNAPELNANQRTDLLGLIDRPAYGPSDYDAKERELKTSPKFAKLYRSIILPDWFPRLRATKFAITTRLKPLSDQALAEVIKTTPELMSLNQMFRVARLYPEGSQDFDNTIATALRYYPDDPVALINSAVAAIRKGEYDRAAKLLDHAGNTPEAENARGVLETHRGNFDAAMRHFDAAGNLPEAIKNKALLNE